MYDANRTRRAVLRTAGGATLSLLGGTGVGSVRGANADYERRYEPLDEPRVDLGAVYIPFLGDMWGRCAKGQPAVGQYSMADSTAVNRHVDQMQGFGISTVMFNFSVLDDAKYFERFVEAELTAEIPIEMFHNISNALKWRGEKTVKEQIDAHAAYIREQFLRRENVSTHRGRPVVSFWDVDYLAWGGNEKSADVKKEVLDEWGTYEDFVSYLRSQLTVDGTDPYLVGDFHNNAIGGYSEEAAELNRQFDAATTWTGHTPSGETVPWEVALEHVRRNYEATRSFADANDMDFVPTVFPGFDDRGNECWGGDKHVPRAPAHLTAMLELADEYRTTDRINLATFNDWTEGHHVEPGRFAGTDYGTAYLDAIEAFQNNPVTTTTTTTTKTTTTDESPTTTTTGSANAVESTTTPTTEPEVTASPAQTTATSDADQSRTGVPGFGVLTGLAGLGLGLQRYRSTKE